MPKPQLEGFPTPSLVDRLSSDEPDYFFQNREPSDQGKARVASRALQREAQSHYEDTVRRDLEWLFNTRRVPDYRLDKFPESQKSVYNYGLPDVNSDDPNRDTDRSTLIEEMKDAIERFDPRIRDFDIQLSPLQIGSHVLHLQINGLVLMDPAPAEVSFETLVDRTNSEVKVKS